MWYDWSVVDQIDHIWKQKYKTVEIKWDNTFHVWGYIFEKKKKGVRNILIV